MTGIVLVLVLPKLQVASSQVGLRSLNSAMANIQPSHRMDSDAWVLRLDGRILTLRK
jgi:hypothetical protein